MECDRCGDGKWELIQKTLDAAALTLTDLYLLVSLCKVGVGKPEEEIQFAKVNVEKHSVN